LDTFVVDGCNYLCREADHSVLAGKDFETARRSLVRRLEQYQNVSGNRVIVVFDGAPEVSPSANAASNAHRSAEKGFRVIYARTQDADTLIERLVSQRGDGSSGSQRASHPPSRLIVVTADRKLARRTTRFGARAMGHREFTSLLAQTREAWPGRDGPATATQTVFERLDRESLNRLKKLRMHLESERSKSKP
jgi:predicted RNA-binding protein with PIN domain